MNNADLPAMPISNSDLAASLEIGANGSKGLTKREMFAMNAPCATPSFSVDFAERNKDNKSLVEIFKHNGAYKLTTLGDMQMIKEWGYAYADLMLSED